MEVYLIRHTTPQIEQGICYGQSEIPLAKTFTKEAKNLIKLLPGDLNIIYTSPSVRCYKLAKYINMENLIIDERLREMNFGEWEMKKWDDIDKKILAVWMKKYISVRVPGGESFTDVRKRAGDFIDDLSKKDYKKAAIITHGGVIRCMLGIILKKGHSEVFNIPVTYASVTKVILAQTK